MNPEKRRQKKKKKKIKQNNGWDKEGTHLLKLIWPDGWVLIAGRGALLLLLLLLPGVPVPAEPAALGAGLALVVEEGGSGRVSGAALMARKYSSDGGDGFLRGS